MNRGGTAEGSKGRERLNLFLKYTVLSDFSSMLVAFTSVMCALVHDEVGGTPLRENQRMFMVDL